MSLFKPSPSEKQIESTVALRVAAQIDARVGPLVEEHLTALVDKQISAMCLSTLPQLIDARLPAWIVSSREFPTTHEAVGRAFGAAQSDVYSFGSMNDGAPRWWRTGQPNLPEAKVIIQVRQALIEFERELRGRAYDDCLPVEGKRRSDFLAKLTTMHDCDVVLAAASDFMRQPETLIKQGDEATQ